MHQKAPSWLLLDARNALRHAVIVQMHGAREGGPLRRCRRITGRAAAPASEVLNGLRDADTTGIGVAARRRAHASRGGYRSWL